MRERIELAKGRIREIAFENIVSEPFGEYFRRTASFLCFLYDGIANFDDKDEAGLKAFNEMLFEELGEEKYAGSYLNPSYACEKLTAPYGRVLSLLYTCVRGVIPFAHENLYGDMRLEDEAILLELYLEVYSCFCSDEEIPSFDALRQIIYSHMSDYADVTVRGRIRDSVDPSLDFAKKIIEESDFSDLSYLYRFGECIDEDTRRTAAYLASLDEAVIRKMADSFTGGFFEGFREAGKDYTVKKTVGIRYPVGFERVIKASIEIFREKGLESVVFRCPVHLLNKRSSAGYFGARPNRQFLFDHKEDMALILDKALAERYLEVYEASCKEFESLLSAMSGPAVMEDFGEPPFIPDKSPDRFVYDEKQKKLNVEMASRIGRLVEEYMPEEETSYTIIAFPTPRIGGDFEKIFDDVIALNTLDSAMYSRIQQKLIDVMDKGVTAHVAGCNGNETDLTVALWPLTDPSSQTIFENCVASVNIPVGEVFTSPVLEGTNGVLFVKQVYLDGLEYRNLRFVFKDGFVTDYSCDNFDDAQKGREYIRTNVLHDHETLPMGEFAVGTNTTAYAMAVKYSIFDRLNILIAEKTGPHFALGDTCYSHAEDLKVYNPDGKEIVARENSCSKKRNEDPAAAYFNCHTDITMPYEELGELSVTDSEGKVYYIIQNGRFVVPGCEVLNEPLEKI
ncbi:MAG: aminopeptidase [Lachnospiraceae bacterium]|nr:aminopeptidase [Lachnospiraceae bacterium]